MFVEFVHYPFFLFFAAWAAAVALLRRSIARPSHLPVDVFAFAGDGPSLPDGIELPSHKRAHWESLDVGRYGFPMNH